MNKIILSLFAFITASISAETIDLSKITPEERERAIAIVKHELIQRKKIHEQPLSELAFEISIQTCATITRLFICKWFAENAMKNGQQAYIGTKNHLGGDYNIAGHAAQALVSTTIALKLLKLSWDNFPYHF